MKDRSVSLVQLICGQLSVALLMAVIPGLLILGLFGGLPWPTCVAGLLISVHFLLMSLEFASRGKWVPSGWRGVSTLVLPIVDILIFAWLLKEGAYSWAIITLGLLILAAALCRKVVLRWKSRKPDREEVNLPVSRDSSGAATSTDNDLAMMDF